MARKVFISILGISYYNRTKYYFDTKSDFIETRFIQKATLKFLSQGWNKNDHAYFFLTKDAKETNWSSPAQTNHYLVRKGERDTYTGLKEVIEKCLFPYDHTTVNIPNGNNETEIWQIFETVFGVLEENDEVYFDITHAFRSIPMLVMVLINYAKFLKNISVISITYGNWEGRDKDNNLAPIIDLTAFSELQDWTSAAASFIKTGNTYDIANLITDKKLKELFEKFSDIHFVVRGKEIYNGKIQRNLTQMLTDYQEQNIKPFHYVKQQIIEKIKDYNEDIMNNALIAIKYCIDHNLIQQGFTLLDESLITSVLLKTDFNWEIQYYRDVVSSCLNITKKEKFDIDIFRNRLDRDEKQNKISSLERDNYLSDIQELINKTYELPFIKKLQEIMLKVSHGSRNDINHAGIREKPREAVGFKKSLDKYFEKFKKIVQNF